MESVLSVLRFLDKGFLWVSALAALYTRSVGDESYGIFLRYSIPSMGSMLALGVLLTKRRQSFSLIWVLNNLSYFWPGLLIGTVSKSMRFSLDLTLSANTIYHGLLVISCILHAIYLSLHHTVMSSDNDLRLDETMLVAGFSLSLFLLPDTQLAFGMLCCCVYILIVMLSLKKKAIFTPVTFLAFVAIGYKTFLWTLKDEETAQVVCWTGPVFVTVYSLADPITVFVISHKSLIDMWQPLMAVKLCILRLSSVLIFFMELSLLIMSGITLQNHKEWWVLIPAYAIMSITIWLPLHFAYTLTLWKIFKRLYMCNEIYKNDQSRSLRDIMASRGMRHFSLIVYPLMWLNLIFTFVMFVISWTCRTPVTAGLILTCLPIQTFTISFLRELTRKLGGSCCGYALVTPSVIKTVSDENIGAAHTSINYATTITSTIQKFFIHQLIEEGGCEYSSVMLDVETLKNKLLTFFNKRSRDGSLFDSYLVYYSGPVHQDGDWCVKGGGKFTYSDLHTLWMSTESCFTARLILVCDTAKSNFWVKNIRSSKKGYIAIQTHFVRQEAERLNEYSIGDFTKDWVEFNCNKDSDTYSSGFNSPIIVTYGVSRHWHAFRFREPSVDEMNENWREHFSVSIKPVIQLITFCDKRKLCACYHAISACCSSLFFVLRPPDQLDIGHGFKLVRFFNLPKGSRFF